MDGGRFVTVEVGESITHIVNSGSFMRSRWGTENSGKGRFIIREMLCMTKDIKFSLRHPIKGKNEQAKAVAVLKRKREREKLLEKPQNFTTTTAATTWIGLTKFFLCSVSFKYLM